MNYHLQIRDGNFNTLFKGGRLTHQYICGNYLDIQTQELKFIQFNQPKLRVDLYKGLCDAFYQNQDLRGFGKLTVLPATYLGIPRSKDQFYYGAIV